MPINTFSFFFKWKWTEGNVFEKNQDLEISPPRIATHFNDNRTMEVSLIKHSSVLYIKSTALVITSQTEVLEFMSSKMRRLKTSEQLQECRFCTCQEKISALPLGWSHVNKNVTLSHLTLISLIPAFLLRPWTSTVFVLLPGVVVDSTNFLPWKRKPRSLFINTSIDRNRHFSWNKHFNFNPGIFHPSWESHFFPSFL